MLAPEARSAWARRSVALKMLAIAGLIIVLLVPTLMLESLISERQMLRDSVQREISAMWGGEQTIGGPVLTVPYTERVINANGSLSSRVAYAHFLPEELRINGIVNPEVRKRGIYRAVLYNTQLRVQGTFERPNITTLGLTNEQVRWGDAFVAVGVPDLRGVKEPIGLRWSGRLLPSNPGIPTDEVFASGVSVPVDLTQPGGTYPFELALNLNGSGALAFLPFGEETQVTLRSPWPHPSFTGAFSTDASTVSDSGFTATWRVLHVNRNYGQRFLGRFAGNTSLPMRGDEMYVTPAVAENPSAFGVRLLLPVDEYQKTMRASKYAMLFVFLTFLTFFFVEVLGGRRIHPVQYLLVGFAICLFYLLLLSFTEHVPFSAAYWGTTVLILGMILLYSKAIFKSWKLAATVVGLLLIFDTYFFILLQLQEYALLAGSLGLLVTLAAVMYLSRRVDWYGLSEPAGSAEPLPSQG